jgi:hypothetical protein
VTPSASPELLTALELPQGAPREAVVKRLARFAETAKAQDDEGVETWTKLVTSIDQVLSPLRGETLETAAAAHLVVADVEQRSTWDEWERMFGDPSLDPAETNPDERLRQTLFRLLPALASAFHFELR